MRALRILLVGVLVGAAALVGAPAASALATCTVGLVDLPNGLCMDPVTGKISGDVILPQTQPQRVTLTSSQLAAANGPGGTVAENAAGAARNGAIAAAGKIGMLGRLGQGVALYSGFEFGYSIGTQISNFLCTAGADMLCNPNPAQAPQFIPNADVNLTDPGWFGPGNRAGLNLGSGVSGDVEVIGTAPTAGSAMPAKPATVQFMQATYSGPSVNAGFAQAYSIGSDGKVCTRYAGMSQTFAGVDPTVITGQSVPFGWFPGPGFYACASGSAAVLPQGVVIVPAASAVPPTGLTTGAVVDFGTGSGWVGYWLPGAAQRPPAQDPDPTRTLVASADCVTLATGQHFTVTAASASFKESDQSWPVLPQVDCGPGAVSAGIGVKETSPGLPEKQVWTSQVPQQVQDAIADATCSGGRCRLTLAKVAGADQGDCFEEAGRCEGWFADPNKQTTYQCSYGLPGSWTGVDLSECNVYAPTFDAQQQAKGIPYADPATGAIPATATGQDPAEGGDGGDGGCWPTGWGVFNPLGWVLQPLKCAFIPTAAQWQSATESFVTGYQGTSIYKWWQAISGTFGGMTGGSDGCSPWTVQYPMPTGGDTAMTVLNPCTGPMQTVAGVGRTVLTVVMVLLGALAVLRGLLTVGFGIPVTLGRGAGQDASVSS